MKLPPDHLELVRNGAAVLVALAAQLRVRVAARPDVPELWLSIRDYEGLAGRLADYDAGEWRAGYAGGVIGAQDFGVLDELVARRNDTPVLASEEQASTLARLRHFLRQYCDGAFDFDESGA
jgi:hypothetical protein